jgi:branched-chain amino acid transport system ATP-binding protein
VLETRGLGIRFGGHVAVDAVSCSFAAGTLTAIVGPNGAGKTTYFNLISGQLAPTTGSVQLDGRLLDGLAAPERARRGVGRAFQLTQLFPSLSVLEHVRLALQALTPGSHKRGLDAWRIWSDHRDLTAGAEMLLETLAMRGQSSLLASQLSHGDQRKLEVALLMALDPRVYMFDEPTAGMSHDEAPVILELIRKLKARRDRVILLVEHKMDVVRELADRIVVLHNGALVADGAPQNVMDSKVVREAYLGARAQP